MLVGLVDQYGENCWSTISAQLKGRSVRQCKERYYTYLSPSVKKSPWTAQEDEFLLEKVKDYGRRWSDIAKFFEGRTPNACKNRYHLQLRAHRPAFGSALSENDPVIPFSDYQPALPPVTFPDPIVIAETPEVIPQFRPKLRYEFPSLMEFPFPNGRSPPF
jgi:hypothetical protein